MLFLITVNYMTGNKLYERLTLLLLVVLPINYMVFNILLKSIPLIRYSKDLIMISLLGLMFTKRLKIKKDSAKIFLVIIGIFTLIFIKIAFSFNIPDSLYAARLLLVPLLFYLCYNFRGISKALTIKILNVLFCLSVILAIWGIFQAFVLRDTFLIKLNYKGMEGKLSSGFYISGYRGIQRITSTFAAPNLYALFTNMMFFLLVSVKEKLSLKNRTYIAGLIIMLISSVLTFSRSGWLGLAFGSVYYLLRTRKITKKQVDFLLFGGFVIIIITIFVLLTNESIYKAFSLLITRTFNSTDPSLIGHMDSFKKTMGMIISNPFGYKWLGYSGPRTRHHVINYNVESSLLLMGLELGIIGAVLYIVLFAQIIKNIHRSPYKYGIQSAIFATIPSLLLLPLLAEYELTTFVFIMIVLVNNLGKMEEKEYMQKIIATIKNN